MTEDVSFQWYKPERLPRQIALDAETLLALSRADEALGRLAGVGKVLRNPRLLMRPYAVKEALASARIEGTQADLDEVFQAEAKPTVARHFEVATVSNYLRALEEGLESVHGGDGVTFAIVAMAHRTLLGRTHLDAGEVRSKPVWLGSPTDRPHNARFVPPVGSVITELLDDWEEYLATPPPLPTLIRAALLHYQFLTIHPFRDGNGRAGRLFVLLFLSAEGRLPVPLLYLSPFFERKRQEYYDRLQAVRDAEELQQWLQFFLTAVEAQANDGVDRVETLLNLRERYRQELAGTRNRSSEVVELLFENPVVSASVVRDSLGVTTQGALNLVRSLEARGWLEEFGTAGRGGGRLWIAAEIYRTLATDIVSEGSA